MNHGLPKPALHGASGRIAVVLSVLLYAATAAAAAGDDAGQFWLISTRCAPVCGRLQDGDERIRFWRRLPDDDWAPAGREEFLDDCKTNLPTTVVVHGNLVVSGCAVDEAAPLYRRIQRLAAGRPYRLVIWSWPSQRVFRSHRQDARVKAARSDVQSYYLAECLERVDPKTPVGLIGYSFGARVITGALHLLGGGELAGRTLKSQQKSNPGTVPIFPQGKWDCPPRESEPRRRALLVAPALDSGWLLPGRRNDLAPAEVEQMLVTKNCCDCVLRWYPLMYCRGGPRALGYAGMPRRGRSENIELLDVACSVGRNHDWSCYLASTTVNRRLAWLAFLESAAAE